jgi:hypothetical protein
MSEHMTVTGGDAPSEETRVDREPPEFPRVSGSSDPAAETRADHVSAPLFSRAGESHPPDEPPLLTAPVATGRGPGRWRWVAAGLATLLVVVVIGAVLFFAGPRSGTPSTASLYAPSETVAYVELRHDLPGDQRDRLARFMSHFPGFADPAAFQQKLDESLDQILETSGSGLDWQADVEPWFGGQIALFTSELGPTEGTPPSVTIALSVKDRTRLDALVQERVGGTDAIQEDHQGQTIWTLREGLNEQRLSFAVTDEVLLFGLRVEDVKEALDVRADRREGLADDEFFLEQLAALHADRLATLYFDGRGIAEMMRDQLGDPIFGPNPMGGMVDAVAIRVMGEFRAEGDHLALTTRSEQPSSQNLPPIAANTSTNLAEAISGDAIFYSESRQVGQGIGWTIDQLMTSFEDSGMPVDLGTIEQLLGTAPQDYFDFLQDVGIAAGYSDGRVEVGLIATVDDEGVARTRVERLLTFARTAALAGGLEFDEQQHGAATITVVELGPMLGGLDDELGGLGSVSVTVTNGRLYIGAGDFVTNALDRNVADSLASRPEYSGAVQAVGTSNAGVMFLDIGALRAIADEHLVPEADRDEYEREYKPFIEPLSHLAVVGSNEGGITVNHVFLYVE